MDRLTDSAAIDRVAINKLLARLDERGRLFEILRCDQVIFKHFGQVFVATAYPGIVKAWHFHKIQKIISTAFKARFVLYDPGIGSSPQGKLMEFLLGPENLMIVTILPEGWWQNILTGEHRGFYETHYKNR